jgi:hypothetical protein
MQYWKKWQKPHGELHMIRDSDAWNKLLKDQSNAGYTIGTVLHCPNCGFNYLHHEAVTVYDRGEDAEQTGRTEISGVNRVVMSIVSSDKSGNPSSRRDGLAIRFWCEGCPAKPELTVVQHKGETYLAWRNVMPPEDSRSSP